MDQFSLESHQRASSGQEDHHYAEIQSIFANNGEFYLADDGVRRDTSIEKLATLKTVF